MSIFVRIGVISCASLLSLSYLSDSRALFHTLVTTPLIQTVLDPEDAHKLAIWFAKHKLSPKDTQQNHAKLSTTLFGKCLVNPVGLAAGFDKHGQAIDALFDMGFGFVEIGSVTPEPQPGNPLPRMFRLPADKAVINRYGFNSDGHVLVLSRLVDRLRAFQRRLAHTDDAPITPKSLLPNHLLGINLGKNKSSPGNSNTDFINGINTLGHMADYIVINISSPNTPGLRSLQRRQPMLLLLKEAVEARNCLLSKPPLLVKIAPDLDDQELLDIATVVQEAGIDGVIISNTTISRPTSLITDSCITHEAGGLSGPPLKDLSLQIVGKFYAFTHGSIPIIGCGGISSGADAIEYARAGASAIQLYTSLGYHGPGIVRRIKDEIVAGLGESKWDEIIGTNHTLSN